MCEQCDMCHDSDDNGTKISKISKRLQNAEMDPCAVFQKNDIYSGLGDDSSSTLDSQCGHEQGKLQEAHRETAESDGSEGIEGVSGTDDNGGPRNHRPAVDSPSDNVEEPLRVNEERYYSHVLANLRWATRALDNSANQEMLARPFSGVQGTHPTCISDGVVDGGVT